MTGSARIVVIVAGILACVAFAHYMRGGATIAPTPVAPPKAAVVSVPAHAAAPAAAPRSDDVPPWLRTDLATATTAATPAPIVPTPREQAATIVADPRRTPVFTAAGVDMEAIRNNQRLADQIRPLLVDVRRLAAEQTPESRKALEQRFVQIRALQAQMVYDVRSGAHR
jgi:hypothetical protein